MHLIAWFLKWARAEKDKPYLHHGVEVGLATVTSVITAFVTHNQFHKDLGFSMGMGVVWLVLWTIVVWRPWRATPEFDLEKDKEKKD